MTRPASVTAEELVRALKRRQATLPAEIGSFVVLEACEALLVRGPELLTLDGVHISEEGSVWLPSGTRCSEADAAVALHGLLASILVAAGPAPLPALMRLLEKGPSGGSWTLSGMRDDLEASLVPLNRGASRRVLARFVREIGRAERAPASKPSFNQLDSELSSFLGVEELPPAPVATPVPSPPPVREEHDDSADFHDMRDAVRFFESVRPLARPITSKTEVDHSRAESQTARDAREPAVGRRASGRAPPAEHSASDPPRESQLDLAAPRKTKALLAGGVLLVLSALLLVVTLKLRPELQSRFVKAPVDAAEAGSTQRKLILKRPPSGDLVVRVSTERAQILLLVGRGPVSVPHLPLGVAHEFVAVADGLSPARLLIPANADWETTPDGRRYEAAMQLGEVNPSAPLELGDTLLPQDVGSPSGNLGTVRVVTTPRGAKVYQVIGFAPEARVEQLPLDATQELLVYRKGYAPELRVVAPSDYLDAPPGQALAKRAELDVTLSPLPNK
jgi:hypothetical protein